MDDLLSKKPEEFLDWSWDDIKPYFEELSTQPLRAENLNRWLGGYSDLARLFQEIYWRLYVARTIDTTDEAAKERYDRFLDEVRPKTQAAEQALKEKLLASGLQPHGFELPLKKMQAEVELYREENLPLLSEELKLSSEYDERIGDQTVLWEGEERTLAQLQPLYQSTDRERRERAWRLAAARQLADREAIDELWGKLLAVRSRLAANAGLPDYRSYRWKQLLRFDYSPEDCRQFHRAIEAVAVPAARRIYERRRERLGVERLRPWDLEVDPSGKPPLKPFDSIQELEGKTSGIFRQVDPPLGEYFETMRREGLLDLENRKGKAPGGYCTEFEMARRPFIFMNSVGVHDDVQTLLHEGGHAFHVFETEDLPYHHQLQVPLEFAEVASMSMELLASPYLDGEEGFYSHADATRARIAHLEQSILFWPYMAVVDAFQHWVYENREAALNPGNCDAQWSRLWERFMPVVDWSGLEEEKATGWQRKLHIFTEPFYYVEYGLAQSGAFQVWRNAIQDQASAVNRYRKALSLGGTLSIPELYAAAGARFAFDEATLREVVRLAEERIDTLRSKDDWNDIR